MKKTTRKIVFSGVLIALDVILSRILAINTSVMKIGLGFLAVALCAYFYGPWWAGACAAIGDIIGSLIFPTGAYFPGFTLTAALTGIVFGLFLKPYSRWRGVIAAVINVIAVSFFANSYMISYISDAPYTKLLATRAVQLAVMLPLQGVVLGALLPVIAKQIEKTEKI